MLGGDEENSGSSRSATGTGQPLWKTARHLLRRLNLELLRDPGTPPEVSTEEK